MDFTWQTLQGFTRHMQTAAGSTWESVRFAWEIRRWSGLTGLQDVSLAQGGHTETVGWGGY